MTQNFQGKIKINLTQKMKKKKTVNAHQMVMSFLCKKYNNYIHTHTHTHIHTHTPKRRVHRNRKKKIKIKMNIIMCQIYILCNFMLFC